MMYRSSKTIAVLASFAILGAAPLIAGPASVPNTSTATTALTATSVAPAASASAGGSPKTALGGGGSAAKGYGGPALHTSKISAASASGIALSNQGLPTTLGGLPAQIYTAVKDGQNVYVIIDQSGNVATYPVD